MRKLVLNLIVLCGPVTALGQATYTPSFNAPYRAFLRHEFGATVTFPKGANYGVEGQYRFGYENFDVGVRGGIVTFASGPTVKVVAAEGRTRGFSHTEGFPLDGALIVGVGGHFVSTSAGSSSTGYLTTGFSLGRRIDPQDTQISIVPYAEPTLFLVSNSSGLKSHFALGLGSDFRLSKLLDARASIGLGDVQGISFSAVWVH
jgi:hypothetical protein